jgi:hypothetical protein
MKGDKHMKLIDADRLFDIISKDRYEMDAHSNPQSKSVHHGEYQHFLKRIAEQPAVHLSIDLCYTNGESIKNVDLV